MGVVAFGASGHLTHLAQIGFAEIIGFAQHGGGKGHGRGEAEVVTGFSKGLVFAGEGFFDQLL